jgi:predicted nuclease of predicted toxin-antitoxin system
MRWLADECVAAALVGHLRAIGHDVSYVAEGEASASDTAVVRLAHGEERLLLTEDKDFGELAFRLTMPLPGVVLIRLGEHDNALKWARLEAAIKHFAQVCLGDLWSSRRSVSALGHSSDPFSDNLPTRIRNEPESTLVSQLQRVTSVALATARRQINGLRIRYLGLCQAATGCRDKPGAS